MSAAHRPGDAGETLVELLLAVMIMGVCTTAIMGTVMLTASASAQHESSILTATYARTWAERLTVAPFRGCASPSTTVTPPESTGWSGAAPQWTRRVDGVQYTATVESVEHWSASAGTFGSACPAGSGASRYRIRVSSPGLGMEGSSQSLAVVSRNPCASTSEAGCS